MTKQYDFEVVPDDRRRAAVYPHRATSPLWLAIRDGKTLVVHDVTHQTFRGARGWLKRQGLFLHIRTEPDGAVLMWADRQNGSS